MFRGLIIAFVISVISISGCGGSNSISKQSKSYPVGKTISLSDNQYPSIQDAINAGNPGDTVVLGAGYFREMLQLREGVNIKGIPSKTFLFGGIFADGISEGTMVYGLMISPPVDNSTARIARLTNSNVVFDHCTFLSGDMAIDGNSSPDIRNCTFNGLVLGEGNIVFSSRAISLTSGHPVISRCIFTNWATALDASGADNSTAGAFGECLFFNNGSDIAGRWFGVLDDRDPLYTNRPGREYYLDDQSPAILAGSEYIGAWEPARFAARPLIRVTKLDPAFHPGFVNVLQAKISATGEAGASVYVSSIYLKIATNHSVNQFVAWTVYDVEAGVKKSVDSFNEPIIDGEVFVISLASDPLVVKVGEEKTYDFYADLSAFNSMSYTVEVMMDSIIWTDGNIVNSNSKNIGLAGSESSGVFYDP